MSEPSFASAWPRTRATGKTAQASSRRLRARPWHAPRSSKSYWKANGSSRWARCGLNLLPVGSQPRPTRLHASMVVEMISQLFQLVRNGAFDHAAMFGHLVQARLYGIEQNFRD